MLSTGVLGGIEKNCSHAALGGLNANTLFGGIPIVILMGDDMQLPAVVTYKNNHQSFGAAQIQWYKNTMIAN